jgi:hypothetical protein
VIQLHPPGTRLVVEDDYIAIGDEGGGCIVDWAAPWPWWTALADAWERHRARTAPYAEEAAAARQRLAELMREDAER